MASGGVSLQNFLLFPPFAGLPAADELDAGFYAENAQGMLLPSRTWCFVAEIVSDALSQEAVLGHRVEVRDLCGDIKSVLFYPPDLGAVGAFRFTDLRAGSTLFIRYAQRCYFSDLATEAIKVEEMQYVKVIPSNLDTLLYISQTCIGGGACQACNANLTNLGGNVTKCELCEAASYCSQPCRQAHAAVHGSYCFLCQELGAVFNVDLERFTNYIPFR